MKILITGSAGFVGFQIAKYFKEHYADVILFGVDNLSRRGSENNISKLKEIGGSFFHVDIRNKEDVEDLPKVDWIIDCAANPSVLAGLNGGSMSLINNNLTGTIHLLEKCKRDNAGFIMLSTSRVYSIEALNTIPISEKADRFGIQKSENYPPGFSELGINELFSTQAPISLYGATKLTSEILTLEYHHTFGFPVWVNRCGVLAGPGQFGKIDQGIFSFWIYQYLLNKPLSFIGYGGMGKQVRDLFHVFDLFKIIDLQICNPEKSKTKIFNLGGGLANSYSLLQLDKFCKENISKEKNITGISENRNFDIPLYISDYNLAESIWGWKPTINAESILMEILKYGSENLELLKQIA